MKLHIKNIKWDADDPDDFRHLPTEMLLDLDLAGCSDEDEVDDLISEALTSSTGFCHKGFELVGDVAPMH